MKNLLAIILITSLSITQTSAQDSDWQMRLGGGYFVGGKVRAVQGLADVTDGGSFEAGIQYRVGYQRYVGIRYLYAGTGLDFIPYNEYSNFNRDIITMNAHFVGIATTQYFTNYNTKPYFESTFNANIYAPYGYQNSTFFSLGLGAGAHITLSEMAGLRIGGEVQLPFGNSAEGVYCGIGSYTGPNCGLSLNGTVLATQLNFGAAFTFNL